MPAPTPRYRGCVQRLPYSGRKSATVFPLVRGFPANVNLAYEMHISVGMVLRCLYIDTPDPAFLKLQPGFRAEFVGPDELDRYVEQPDYGLTEQFVNRELAMGHECFAIRHGDALATYGWYSTTATHFTDDLSVRFDRHWVYMHSGFTHPMFRGRRLHAYGMTIVLTLYRARGYKGLVSIVEGSNTASLKSCARMGYRHFGTIYTARPGRVLARYWPARLSDRAFVLTTPGCRAFGFRLDRTPVDVVPVDTPARVTVATADVRS